MTVAAAARRIIFNGSGSTGPFQWTFRTLIRTNLTPMIAVTKIVGGVPSTLSYPADFSFTAVGGGLGGGSITLGVALAVGEKLVVQGDTDITQPTDYANQGRFAPETHEQSYDRLTVIVQEQQELFDRIPTMPVDFTGATPSFPTPVATSIIGWDSSAVNLINYTPASLNLLTAFYQDASLNVSLNRLGSVTTGVKLDVNGVVGVANGTAAAPALTFNSDIDTGLYRVSANKVGIAALAALCVAFTNPASAVNNWNIQGAAAGSPAYVSMAAEGTSNSVGVRADTKGTTTSGSQYYGTTDTSGKFFIRINGVNCAEFTDTWWNPNVSYQGAPTAWPVFSSGALAGGPDNICVIGCNSSIYDNVTVTGVSQMICARGTTGMHHFTSNGVVGHVNISAITNPNGVDTYCTAASSLWLYGTATGAAGGAVISTQGATANGTLFYDAGTGGYEWKTDNTATLLFKMNRTASGVNAWSVTAATAGNAPIFQPYGSDAAIGCIYKTKGTTSKLHTFYDSGAVIMQIGGASTSDTYLSVSGGVGTVAISAQGSGSNGFVIYNSSATGAISIKCNNTSSPVMDFLAVGRVKFTNSAAWNANGTATVTISNLAPAAVTTATIKKWLRIQDDSGTELYIPAWGA